MHLRMVGSLRVASAVEGFKPMIFKVGLDSSQVLRRWYRNRLQSEIRASVSISGSMGELKQEEVKFKFGICTGLRQFRGWYYGSFKAF